MYEGILANPDFREFVRKHPRLSEFIKKRFSPNYKYGLYLTIGETISLFFFYLFLGVVEDYLSREALIHSDLRIINLLQIFRTPAFNRLMVDITHLGNAQVIIAGTLLFGIWCVYIRKWSYLTATLISVIGGSFFVEGVKLLFHRPRPSLTNAVISAGGYSFPSGHSFVALSFYGLMTYFIIRNARSNLLKILAFFVGLSVVFLLGFSRLYLGVHWPSDVLASYTSGLAWITAVITAMEIHEHFNTMQSVKPVNKRNRRMVGPALILGWAGFVGIFNMEFHPAPPTDPEDGNTRVITYRSLPEAAFGFLPRVSEDIIGTPMEPVNVMIVGTRLQMDQAFQDAGWLKMDPITFHSVWKLIRTAISGKAYPRQPGIPAFWNTKPNPFGYEKPTPEESISQRYHIHVWETPLLTTDGRRIWFGTVHFDQTIQVRFGFLPMHVIQPDIDEARNVLQTDLNKTRDVITSTLFQVVKPELGRNQLGEYFFTDGDAIFIVLRDSNAVMND